MAAQQIPSGNQGLRVGARRIGNGASPRPFEKDWRFEKNRLFEAKRNEPVRVLLPSTPRPLSRSRAMNPVVPRHVPVLGRQAIEMLNVSEGGIYVDATFGAGGYSRAILDTAGTRVVGIDRDRLAISGGFELVDQSRGRLTLVE